MTTYKLPGVKPHVVAAAQYFGNKYGIKTVYGFGPGSVPNSDHPKGLALDFMTSNKATGDALASDLIAQRSQWNVKYVVWYRRIWTPTQGWHNYTGPRSHTDHVHASFNAKPGTNGGSAPADTGTTVPVGLGNALMPDSVNRVFDKLSDPWLLKALSFYALGAGLIIAGFLLITVGSLPSVGTAAKIAKVVAK